MTPERRAVVQQLLLLATRFEAMAEKSITEGTAAIPDRLVVGTALVMAAAHCWQGAAWTLRTAIELLDEKEGGQ